MKKFLNLRTVFSNTIPCLIREIVSLNTLKTIPNTCVSIRKKVENLSRNRNGKIKLVDISLLSNCNNFIKPKNLKPKCIQKIFNPSVHPSSVTSL